MLEVKSAAGFHHWGKLANAPFPFLSKLNPPFKRTGLLNQFYRPINLRRVASEDPLTFSERLLEVQSEIRNRSTYTHSLRVYNSQVMFMSSYWSILFLKQKETVAWLASVFWWKLTLKIYFFIEVYFVSEFRKPSIWSSLLHRSSFSQK